MNDAAQPSPEDLSGEEVSDSALDSSFYRWINKAFLAKAGKQVLKIDLYHVSASMQFIQKWDGSEIQVSPQILLQEIQQAAEQDAEPMTGVQTYVTVIFYTDPKHHESIRRQFHIKGGTVEAYGRNGRSGSGSLDTESPDGRGIVAMSMRHTNAMAESLLRGSAQAQGALTRALEIANQQTESANRALSDARQRELEIIKIHSELLIKKDERDFENEDKRDMRKVRNSLIEKAGEGLMPALGPILAMLGGKLAEKIVPNGPKEEVLSSLVQFAGTLDQSAIEIMIASLPNDEQKKKFIELLTTVAKAQQAAAQAQAAAEAEAKEG